MRFRFSVLMLTLAAVLSLAAAAQAGPYYYLTDLGNINGADYARAAGLNNNGDVVGRARINPGETKFYAFLYTAGTMYSLGSLDESTQSSTVSEAFSINDSGQIAGYSKCIIDDVNTTRAFRYQGWEVVDGNLVNGEMKDLDVLTIIEDGQTKVGTTSRGQGINEAGQVVGWSSVGYNRAFLSPSPDDDMVEVGYIYEGKRGSAAIAVNNNENVTGWSYDHVGDYDYLRAFIKNPGEDMVSLGAFGETGSSQGNAINDSNTVAGYSTGDPDAPASHDKRAFLWTAEDGMIKLGTLGTGDESEALGINADGDVVGYSNTTTYKNNRAFLYTDGAMLNLNDRIHPSLGWTLFSATDINDNGQICGYGNNGTVANASFILDPAIPGDANLDKSVDLLDLTILGSNWRSENKKWWDGDFNDDGVVDLLDLTILGGNWRSTTTSFSEAMRMVQFNEIPEPGTFVLLAAAAIGLAAEFLRRRRHK